MNHQELKESPTWRTFTNVLFVFFTILVVLTLVAQQWWLAISEAALFGTAYGLEMSERKKRISRNTRGEGVAKGHGKGQRGGRRLLVILTVGGATALTVGIIVGQMLS
ncbi:hypothetical protein [Streptomyces chumphonensis]|uniref:hypothetical protein n=1 Tax=Streptomyces chumphonensis TaxID=1214925 RepID=UPI003D74B340